MTTSDPLALLALLTLSAMGAGFSPFHVGTIVALLAQWLRGQSAKCANNVPRYFLGKPCRRSKVPKCQKCRARNMHTDGER